MMIGRIFSEQDLPLKDITPLALEANADGMVLLENDGFLPLKTGDRVSVFGRMQSEYNHGGTGSGGLINIPYKTNIYDELEKMEILFLIRNCEMNTFRG